MKDYFEELTERVYEKYPKDNDIWLLLQEVIHMKQKVEMNMKKIEEIEKAISPILLAEAIAARRESWEEEHGV